MTEWDEACQKGWSAKDSLHGRFRGALMQEDKGEVIDYIVQKGISINSYNGLAEKILKYHDKVEMLKFLKGLKEQFIVTLFDSDKKETRVIVHPHILKSWLFDKKTFRSFSKVYMVKTYNKVV